jgi:hypothetical protein
MAAIVRRYQVRQVAIRILGCVPQRPVTEADPEVARPMIISRDELHSPEIEAASDGFTARFSEIDDQSALAEAMIAMEAGLLELEDQAPKIVEFCPGHYSVEAMAEGALGAINVSMSARVIGPQRRSGAASMVKPVSSLGDFLLRSP